MADEIPPIVPEVQEPKGNPAQDRINQLSDKVRQEAEARTAAETKAAEAERKAAFAEGYADMIGTYPAAKEFKADIQAKVMSGYSVEDATLAVLGKAGKLGNTPAPEVPNPAGGSAPTVINQATDKSPTEMSTEEKRAALVERYG